MRLVICEACVCVPVVTLLGSRLLLLHLLDEQVEHLCLDELLDKVSRGLGLNGLVEGPLLKRARLSLAIAFHV